ncbi:MAG: hypothetical protein WD278_14130 [Pirellulales bacterium]
MKTAPKRKQESMNRCLVEIGTHFPKLTQKCIGIGKRLEVFKRTAEAGSRVSIAPRWGRAARNALDAIRFGRIS